MMRCIGNDVVDLRDPRCAGKSADQRFLDRVFTRREAAIIGRSPRPDEDLWVAWAAKEAAFKVVTKLAGSPPPFRHAAFEFMPVPRPAQTGQGSGQGSGHGSGHESGHGSGRIVEGSVEYRRSGIPIAGVVGPDRIHLVAWYPRTAEPPAIRSQVKLLPEASGRGEHLWKESVRDRFTDREWKAVHRPASALARLNARSHLAEVLGVDEGSVEIVCDDGPPGRMPPYVLLSGKRWDGDLTLSHHGRFLAWAFLYRASGR